MKFIQLNDYRHTRLNLENIVFYAPMEWVEKDGITKHYGVEIRLYDAYKSFYYSDKQSRDQDIELLDFVCVENKRGDVRELSRQQKCCCLENDHPSHEIKG